MFDVITIGTATRDVFLKSPFFKILRDSEHLNKNDFPTGEAQCFSLGAKIEIDEPIFTTGGGASNTAVTFSRQGLKTGVMVKIGMDESAESILSEFKKEKIIPLAIKDKEKNTAFSAVLLASNAERSILVYHGASEDLKLKEIPFSKLTSRWVYISPGRIPYPVIEKIFNHFSKNKTLIVFNPSRYFLEMGMKKLKPLLNKTKAVILNREEAAILTKTDYGKEKEIFKKLDKAVDGIAVMTEGEKGVMVSDGRKIFSAGIFKGKAINRLGAGDAFGSGFVAGLMKFQMYGEEAIKYGIRLGSANATSVIEQIGAKKGILTGKEFEKSKRWRNLPIKIL